MSNLLDRLEALCNPSNEDERALLEQAAADNMPLLLRRLKAAEQVCRLACYLEPGQHPVKHPEPQDYRVALDLWRAEVVRCKKAEIELEVLLAAYNKLATDRHDPCSNYQSPAGH